MTDEDREEWARSALDTLRRLDQWWEAYSPDRKFGAEEAHYLANTMVVVKLLIAEREEEDPSPA